MAADAGRRSACSACLPMRARCRRRRLPLDDALGRVLAEDLTALRTQPPAAVSAMDGYAVRAADVAQAPVKLKLIGEVAAGHPFEGEVEAGPGGAHLHRRRDAARRRHRGDPGTHRARRRYGHHSEARLPRAAMCATRASISRKASRCCARARRLTDRDLMLAAAMNYPDLARAPPAQSRGARHRRRAGGAGQQAAPGRDRLFQRLCAHGAGAQRRRRGDRSRHRAATASRTSPQRCAVRATAGADILLTSGGASVGEHDLVQRALAAEGLALSFWRVALRPGRPMMHGRLGAHAGARRAGQSGVVLCLRLPVPGAADPRGWPAAAMSSARS